METKELYRILVVGPTGAGKSQFCNFVQKDKTNSINQVNSSANSCTHEPKSNIFERGGSNYDFIDTAGSSDSSGEDNQNFEKLVSFLKEKGTIDYITLLLKFNEIITKQTRDYIKTLGKIFTPHEFYSHLCVFFTKYPEKPKKKEITIKNNFIKDINSILKNAFNIKEEESIGKTKIYFIDTDFDEEEETFIDKYQDTIDIMLEQMKLDVEIYKSIDCTNFDSTGTSVLERSQTFEAYLRNSYSNMEKELHQRELEEKEKNSLKQELEKGIEDDAKRKKIEKKLQELLIKHKKEKELVEKIKNDIREKEKRQKIIEEKAIKKGILIENLDKIIDKTMYFGEALNRISLYGIGVATLGGGLIISNTLPVLGVMTMIASSIYVIGCNGISIGALFFAGGTGLCKEIIKLI